MVAEPQELTKPLATRSFERIAPLEHIEISRSDASGHTVEAYASVFNSPTEVGGYYFVDDDPTTDQFGRHQEVVDPGAFDETLRHHGTQFQVLYNHGKTIQGSPAERYSMPIGTPLEIVPDSRGLLTITRYADTPLGNEVIELIRNGSIRSQSFSGRVIKAAIETERSEDGLDLVRLSEIALREYGPCPFPAYKDADIITVRADFLSDQLEGLSDEERNELLERLRVTLDGATPEAPDPFESELSRYARERPQELARMIQGAITLSDAPAPASEPEATPEQERTEMVDANKTLTELEARQEEIVVRFQEIDADSGMAPLNETQRTEWDRLKEEQKENAIAIADKRRRIADIGRAIAQPDEERGVPAWQPESFNTKVTRTEDIFDLSTVRGAYDNPEYARQELRDRAMQAVERGNFPDLGRRATKEDMQGRVETLLNTAETEDGQLAQRILRTGHPLYESAFWKKLSGKHLNSQETQVLERALGVATTGYAMPFTLDPTVALTSTGVVNPLRDIARVITITGQTWNGVNSAGITASFVAEATVGTDNAPTLTQKTTTVLKAQAFVPYSIESEAWDGIRAELTLEFQDAKDQLEADKFTLGTGSPLPQGLTIGATSLATTAATATLALSDIDTMTDALPPRYQANATMVMNRKIASKVRQLARTAGATPEWAPEGEGTPGSQNRPGGNLLGYPRRELSSLVGTTTSASLIAYVGDFSRFLIVDRVGMSVEYIPMLFDPTASVPLPMGQRGLYCYWMTTSLVRDANAFRGLKVL